MCTAWQYLHDLGERTELTSHEDWTVMFANLLARFPPSRPWYWAEDCNRTSDSRWAKIAQDCQWMAAHL